jgi:sulfonate transport system substrate-binding protein
MLGRCGAAALVRAVNDSFRAEGKWISENTAEAEHIAQKAGKYRDDHLAQI